MTNCSRLYAHLDDWHCFLIRGSMMMQFHIALGMISKIKTRHMSESQWGFNDSGLQLY